MLEAVDESTHGTKRLPTQNLKSTLLGLPPLPEQQAIAAALADADAAVAALDRLAAKKRDVTRAAAQQLLTGRTRLRGFAGDWPTRRLGDGVELISGCHVLASQCNTAGLGTPYLTGPIDFPDGHIQVTKYTTRPTAFCQPGDILITVKGSGTGKLTVADAAYCISRQLMAIRAVQWNAGYIFSILSGSTQEFEDAATGLIPGLSRSDLLGKTLLAPPIDEQRAIAAVLSDMDAEVRAVGLHRDKLRQVKQGMMQELLTGRKRLLY